MNEIHNRYVASIMPPKTEIYQGWSPCIDWCEENFGDRGWWYLTEGAFEFNNERDYLMFMLRWG
jgi:hypothetical protein